MAEVHTYTVTEMNRLIRNLVEGSGLVAHVQIRGEISNIKRYPSGHCYFSLPCPSAQMPDLACGELSLPPYEGAPSTPLVPSCIL